jgi:anthranilate synthase component 1
MAYPGQKEFLKLSRQGNLIPVYEEIAAGLETPVSAYMKIAPKATYSFLLESVEGEAKIARYSFVACNPELVFETKGRQAKITRFKKGKPVVEKTTIQKTPFDFVRQILKPYQFVNLPGLPRFCGGLVGYVAYDVARFFERLPDRTKDDLNLPDVLLVLAKEIIIFDHLHHKIKIISCVYVPSSLSQSQKINHYVQALKTIQQLKEALCRPLSEDKNNHRRKPSRPIKLSVKSNFTPATFTKAVKKAKQEIRAGEIIQVVLSQRFSVKMQTRPINVYQALRSLNPSPYMFFLNFKGINLIGSSPELLVRCEHGVVETRPIAGTRPRGKNEQEDRSLAEGLLADPKERAEHIMLVDLGRNDLGRVCEKGSVRVPEFMNIEKYSHVMHIVSSVKGKLKGDKDNFDVLMSAFPAGTLSGAPKIRAMEIIEDLEKIKRGPYGGCIGYFSFSGNLDSCIIIRTIIAHKGKAYVQAGAGIVADSDPMKEYQETVNKAKAQLLAIQLAHDVRPVSA